MAYGVALRARERLAICLFATSTFFIFSFFFIFARDTACGILVPQPRIELRRPAVEAQSPNQWATKEVPISAS